MAAGKTVRVNTGTTRRIAFRWDQRKCSGRTAQAIPRTVRGLTPCSTGWRTGRCLLSVGLPRDTWTRHGCGRAGQSPAPAGLGCSCSRWECTVTTRPKCEMLSQVQACSALSRHHDLPDRLRLGVYGLRLFTDKVHAGCESTDVVQPHLKLCDSAAGRIP